MDDQHERAIYGMMYGLASLQKYYSIIHGRYGGYRLKLNRVATDESRNIIFETLESFEDV